MCVYLYVYDAYIYMYIFLYLHTLKNVQTLLGNPRDAISSPAGNIGSLITETYLFIHLFIHCED